MQMFTEGSASIPEKGMIQIPLQLANKLPVGALRLSTKVTSFSKGQVQAANVDGSISVFNCKEIVLAVDPSSAQRFLSDNDKFAVPEGRR
jgi:protoporphyrinogen oxidase